MRLRKHYIQRRHLPLWALRNERATLLLHLSKDMSTMTTLIPHIRLHPTLAPLIWGLTLSLVVTLVSKVPHLMHILLHLFQSSQDLAWQMSSLLVSLVIQIPVCLVVPTSLFIIVLCHHSLTHPYTTGQDRIGLPHMITPRRMINKDKASNSYGLLFLFFYDCWQRGKRIGLKLQEVSPKVLGVERISSVPPVS
jgi:hypothetical protein